MKCPRFPVIWSTLTAMLSIPPLTLPYSSLESGRVGVERAMEAQQLAAQATAETLLEGPGESALDRRSLEASLIDADVAGYLALANARVIQTSEVLIDESTDLGTSSD